MANLKGLAKDTAIYGMSSIVGRFLNYLLVPLYTNYMPKESGDYGVSVNIYAYTALVLVILTFGMETTLFRFAKRRMKHPTPFSPQRWVWWVHFPLFSWYSSLVSSHPSAICLVMLTILTIC